MHEALQVAQIANCDLRDQIRKMKLESARTKAQLELERNSEVERLKSAYEALESETVALRLSKSRPASPLPSIENITYPAYIPSDPSSSNLAVSQLMQSLEEERERNTALQARLLLMQEEQMEQLIHDEPLVVADEPVASVTIASAIRGPFEALKPTLLVLPVSHVVNQLLRVAQDRNQWTVAVKDAIKRLKASDKGRESEIELLRFLFEMSGRPISTVEQDYKLVSSIAESGDQTLILHAFHLLVFAGKSSVEEDAEAKRRALIRCAINDCTWLMVSGGSDVIDLARDVFRDLYSSF